MHQSVVNEDAVELHMLSGLAWDVCEELTSLRVPSKCDLKID